MTLLCVKSYFRIYPVYFCTVYRAQNSDLSHFEAVMSTLTKRTQNSLIWISGDFNLPDIYWEDGLITVHNYPHNFAELLLDFINTFRFTQTVDSEQLFLQTDPLWLLHAKLSRFQRPWNCSCLNLCDSPLNFRARSVPLWHKADFDLICKRYYVS